MTETKRLSIEECQRDLAALDAADRLEGNISGQVEALRNLGANGLMKKAASMMMTGKLSLSALGLPDNFFEQLEQLVKLNNVARKKYRAVVTSDLNQLKSIEEAEVVA